MGPRLKSLKTRWKALEQRVLWGFGDDISTPSARRWTHLHFHVADHAFLRGLWTNLDLVAPGVWRSNQPGPARMARYADMGIRSILTLRGDARYSWLLFQEEAAAKHGMDLQVVSLRATQLADAETLIDALDRMEAMEKPLLIHCKSGADRTGLMSALWLLAHEGASVAEAEAQLSWRYLHRRDTKTGVLDHLIRTYGAARRETGIDVRTWLRHEYDPQAIRKEFAQLRAAKALPR